MNFTIIIKLLGTKNMGSVAYSLYLNEVRKNLTSPDNLLLSSPKGAYCWCSTTGTPDRYVSVGRTLKHASAASPKAPTLVQPSLRAKAITFGLRLASTCFRARRDPLGLAQRFPCYGYASAGDQSTLIAKYPLTNSSGTNLNSLAGPEGGGQDARSNFVPFMQYAG